jgi:thymidine phosphorylase
MSKKLAENLDRLVLDVKFGSDAFMKTRDESEQLAAAMTSIGESKGIKMSHLLSPMDGVDRGVLSTTGQLTGNAWP